MDTLASTAPALDSRPQRHRHKFTACDCRVTPSNWREILSVIPWMDSEKLEAIGRAIWDSGYHARARSSLGYPDEHGHWRYQGKMPRYGRPMKMIDGERLDIVRYARRLAGLPDYGPDWNYTRLPECRVFDCYSPYHWSVDAGPKAAPDPGFKASLHMQVWLHDHPRPPSPRKHAWAIDLATMTDRCPHNPEHTVTVHRARRNSAYCPPCYLAEKDWLAARKSYEAHLRRAQEGSEDLYPAEYASLREAVRLSGEAEAQRTRGQIEIESFPIPENSGETGGLTA